MDSLFAKADAIQPLAKKKKPKPKSNPPKKPDAPKNGSKPARASGSSDRTLASITHTTALPRSLRPRPSSPPADDVPKHGHIKDPKLRTQLNRQAAHAARAKTLLQDAALLLTGEPGCVAVEGGGMEKTWRVGQEEIVKGAGREAALGRKEWRLDGGPYRSRYSRNGRCVLCVWCWWDLTTSKKRHLAIVGHTGHVATFDWQTGTMHAELQLQETCRDITFVKRCP